MENENLGVGSRVRHADWGVGIVVQSKATEYQVTFVNHGNLDIPKTLEDTEVIEAVESPQDLVSFESIESTLSDLVASIAGEPEIIDLGDKWEGGKLIIQPADSDLKPYEMPIENFFHKIVMVRDRLRVMEQRINSSKMTDEEKVNLQQYITRIYGSLTSFNILFKNRDEGFKGSGG